MPRIDKIILLVGLMGSGKTSVGRRLARRLSLPFDIAFAEYEIADRFCQIQMRATRRASFRLSVLRVGAEQVFHRFPAGTGRLEMADYPIGYRLFGLRLGLRYCLMFHVFTIL